MNSSLRSADLATHIKIVVVALVAAIVIVGAGASARIGDSSSTTAAMTKANGLVLRAGKPANITANDISKVR
jgi:hypothetical protein